MRIAVNTRFLLSTKMEGFGWFTYETVKRMVEQHPEDEFFFYFDRKFDQKFVFGPNVTPVILSPQARHPILFKWWFNGSVTKALKKHQPDVFFSPDGYLSLKTNTPQVGVIHDLNFEHYPEDLPKSASTYLRKFFPLFARKADHIITVSEYSKRDIVKQYMIDESKISVAHNGGSDDFKPLDQEGIEKAQAKFAYGHEYFIFVGSLNPRKNLKRLVEAFKAYKSEHPDTTTKLVVVGEEMWKNSLPISYEESTSMSRDIIFTGHLQFSELTEAVGGAKAMMFPSYFEGFGIPLVEAMKAGCPIGSSNKTSLPEVAGEAAVYFDPFVTNEIKEVIKQLDESKELRDSLIQRGFERCQRFNWDFTAKQIWKVLEQFSKE